jgi:hypothetical protein
LCFGRCGHNTEQYKTYHAAISKFCKGVDRTFSDTGLGDICRASASFDKRVLDEVVALHVFREGRFQTAAKLAEEAGLDMAIFQPYKALVGLHEVRWRRLWSLLEGWAVTVGCSTGDRGDGAQRPCTGTGMG